MASQPSGKRPNTKPTMTASVNIQENAEIQEIDAPTETMKKAAPNTATKAETRSNENKEAKDQTVNLLRFGIKLPREIIAMIFEEVADYDPAIAYIHCKMVKGPPNSLVLNTGEKGQKSKFKELVRLAKLLPEFQAIVERRFGHPFNAALAKDPRLGIRKEKDLIVFIFEKTTERLFSWAFGSQSIINRATLAPGIRNVGIRYSHTSCKGFNCYACAACVNDIDERYFCALELVAFCWNLSHVDNIFILVRLESSDVVGTARSKHEKLMTALIADTKRIRNHVSFEDSERTWVEVSYETPRANRDLIRPGLLKPIFRLCTSVQSVNNDQALRMITGNDRRHVRFRVLVGSRWKDATLAL
ncbi:hypothetical protein CI238_09616 [Colletotrichum incanum]|uniref:Uncharacterized protein n=1 Tax=Colletotrichum incanum TaxID=1573173 RepID=A0A161WJV0_COLIC|nr:hypothetical protein CI238_09616 [Colletotrichum incanum]OHW94385.1 hypothetical protein CSPAE12_07008 [Colletotrichum incanum]